MGSWYPVIPPHTAFQIPWFGLPSQHKSKILTKNFKNKVLKIATLKSMMTSLAILLHLTQNMKLPLVQNIYNVFATYLMVVDQKKEKNNINITCIVVYSCNCLWQVVVNFLLGGGAVFCSLLVRVSFFFLNPGYYWT
jgi:hypothetical protein